MVGGGFIPMTTRPAGLGAGSLRGRTQAALYNCQAVGLWRGRFFDVVRGARLRGRYEGAPDGGHVQVRMPGVGVMHPSFATPNETEEALREEEEQKGTARDGAPSGAKAVKNDKGKGKKMISFREYTQSGLHAEWSLVAPQKDFMRLGMEIQTDLNRLGERRGEWAEKAVKAYGLELTTVELVEYIACYCLMEDLWFDVDTGDFPNAVELSRPKQVRFCAGVFANVVGVICPIYLLFCTTQFDYSVFFGPITHKNA